MRSVNEGSWSSLARQAASGVRWTAVSTVSVTAMQTITLIVLAHLLGPTDFGLIAIILLATGFAGLVATMGLGEAIVQKTNVSPEQLDTLYWASVGLGFVVLLLSFVSAPALAAVFSRRELTSMIPVVGVVFLIGSAGNQFSALLQRGLRFKAIAMINVFGVAVGSSLTISLALLNFGVWSLIWGQLATGVTSTVTLTVLAAREQWLPSPRLQIAPIAEFLSFGAYLQGSNLVYYFASRSDQMLVGVLLGTKALGYYSLAFNLVLRPTGLIGGVLAQVAFPVLARAQHDVDRMRRGYFRLLAIVAAVNGPFILGFAALAPVAIPLVLGERWTPISPLVQVLALYAFERAIDSSGSSLLLAVGRARWNFHWALALLVVIPTAVLAGAHFGGLLGVAWALTGIELAVLLTWYALFVRGVLGPSLLSYLASFGLPASFAALMAAVLVALQEVTGPLPRPAALVFLVAAGAVIYVAVYWVFQRRFLIDTVRLLLNRPVA